jgi:uncharacterized protein (TIGR02466 family)
LEQINLFASPLLLSRVEGAESLNARLLVDIDRLQGESDGLQRSNQHGWHSDTSLFSRTEESFATLRDAILHAVAEATQRVSPDFDASLYRFAAEAWVNVNGRAAFNAPHDHPGFCWSGVYYVATPEGQSDRSGQIEFLDPRTNIADMAVPGSAFFQPKFRMQPKAGALIMFPSYLRHWVYPNDSEEARVSVAFNLKYFRKAQTAPPETVRANASG